MLSTVDFILELESIVDTVDIVKAANKDIYYYDIPAAFDIETSSFYEREEKRAIMYIWQFGIYNLVTYGRTWDEYAKLLKAVKRIMNIDNKLRLCVYVHNLPYEFQFMRKRFDWQEVFLLEERKPVYANNNGFEYRCSLKLSGGKSLKSIGGISEEDNGDLIKYPVKKKTGDLDYDKIRTPITEITEKELGYCENDIRVLLHYIQEKIERDGNVTKIPLTNTGYVRQYCREKCFTRRQSYYDMIQGLYMEPDEYEQCRMAFQGGFVHSNPEHTKKILYNVGSFDFKSSYPSIIAMEKFPITRPTLITEKISLTEFYMLLDCKCCLFDLEIYDVVPKLYHEFPLSASKCIIKEGYTESNGRIVSAYRIKTTVTEQDFFTYREFYDFDIERMVITNLRIFEKQYLPKPIIESCLDFYERKTLLDGVKGREADYMISKAMLNAIYGMMVQRAIRTKWIYENDEYIESSDTLENELDKYNRNKKRFLYYPWGIWVTAYARRNLFIGIRETGNDYVYSDTDSIKILNVEKHMDFIERYNNRIYEKIDKVSFDLGIDKERYSPKGLTMGLWNFEGVYDKFKTLGAKRYLCEKDGKLLLTVAGTNKISTCDYLKKSGEPFTLFDNGLEVPKEYSGRNVLSYIDFATSGEMIDYLGNKYVYHEMSSIHMETSEYNLSMSKSFLDYIRGIREEREEEML